MPTPPVTFRAWQAADHLMRGDVLRARLVLMIPDELIWLQEVLFALAWEAGKRDALARTEANVALSITE